MSVSKSCIAVYEGHKQLHLLCMSASTMRITVLWRPEQCASPFFWVWQKFAAQFKKAWAIRISFTWASQKCASRFYEGLKNVHLLFMSLSEISMTIYDGHKKYISFCMRASTVCITVFMKASKMYISFLWVFQQCASRFMKVIKIRISFLWALQQCASRAWKMRASFLWVFKKIASRFMTAINKTSPHDLLQTHPCRPQKRVYISNFVPSGVSIDFLVPIIP